MTRIVGIGGKLASGKDAISDYLVETYGWVKMGMSDPLADALYTLDPLIETRDETQVRVRFLGFIPLWRKTVVTTGVIRYQAVFDRLGYVKAKEIPEVRRLLQILGTEVGRKQLSDGNLWTDIMERKVRQAVESGAPGVIVTGIRFPNETSAIETNLEGELWWVERPSLKSTVNAGHASENSVNRRDFHVEILNDGTLPDLYDKVDRLVN